MENGADPPRLTGDTICHILATHRRPTTVLERIDCLVRHIATRIDPAASLEFTMKTSVDWPIVYARNPRGLQAIVSLAVDQGLVKWEGDFLHLTPSGWLRANEFRSTTTDCNRDYSA